MIDVVRMLSYEFMQYAFIAGICVGIVAPLVGSFLVHREMALIGEALSHTAFAGVAIGIFASSALALPITPYLSALVVAVIAALLIEVIAEYTDAYGDVSMAIVLFGGFALGTALITVTSAGMAVSIESYLFGNIGTVTRQSIPILIGLSILVCVLVALTYKQLLYVTFDETAARVASINVTFYNRFMVVLTAVVVVAAMQIMGVILVAAMLVVPVAAASQVARSFKESLLVSVIVAEIAALVGITLSYAHGVAAGGAIVLVAIGLYGAAVIIDKVAIVSSVRNVLMNRT